ncbi:hypothetical protein PR048_009619 [Dryococelus australis]|uniref:Uncharacterized protein n=1 Tax=Dryococelus australis TaxID=614101 RepID=A0ABQ9I0E8_9NEOP|nr:hypothetical protein PR048_009619 [Dryococelus australis]
MSTESQVSLVDSPCMWVFRKVTVSPDSQNTNFGFETRWREYPLSKQAGLRRLEYLVSGLYSSAHRGAQKGRPSNVRVAPPATTPPTKADPCIPSPCGSNARCRTEGNYAMCECTPDYFGNPYEGCRPECLINSDCPQLRACIHNKCVDPCPGTCGVSAVCSVSNHIPICSCPEGTAGNAFQACIPLPVTVPKPEDPCRPSPCGPNTQCRISDGVAVCVCLPGFEGNPNGAGCRPECVLSSDCPRDKACMNTKCVDPCPGVCGYGARCVVINHSPVCSCPPPTTGDPFTECKEREVVPSDPCNLSPCRPNGQCRVVNGVASCIYPECIINQDCPRDKACYTQRCRDPCVGACGVNAICQVVNHNAICSCPEGYIGLPHIRCDFKPAEPVPKPECTDDSECTNDKACVNQMCRDPCVEQPNTCGQNAVCRVQLHRPLCTCRDGFTGSALGQCYEIGCRSDSDCPPAEACVNKQCENPCSFMQCGTNAVCRPGGNHQARCHCPEQYYGNPLLVCNRAECLADTDCPYNLACRNQRCENPCNCADNALCTVTNHQATCQCPPGYTGNPNTACTLVPVLKPQCSMDADCASKLACFSGVCRNPCTEINPCGSNAECSVVDTLPLRTMSCLCLPGFVGDADVECKPAPVEQPGCKSSAECQTTETCLNRQCLNPCVASNPCAQNADCVAAQNRATCRCPAGLTGDPFVNCYQLSTPEFECTSDLDCANDKSCVDRRCQEPCSVANPCGNNAECHTREHRPICSCPIGWGGNPQIQCYKPECSIDADCVYDKACIEGSCLNPCIHGSSEQCGRGAECRVQAHRAQCSCPAGMQGDPLLACISVICQYNEDCADHEACDRLNRVCRPVCDEETCAVTAVCIGKDHQPTCACPLGSTGNPYIECTAARIPGGQEVECKQDADCPSQLACINQRCEDLCRVTPACLATQECLVLDTLPLRTVMCQCPQDTVTDDHTQCRPIIPVQAQCSMDSECSDTKKCIRGNCVEACHLDQCGVNALCNAKLHHAVCSCPAGFEGNPRIECTRVRVPLPPPPECIYDKDCSVERSCINQLCVNPCIQDNVCGTGAFCRVESHEPVCSCPSGFQGNPRIECRPPDLPVVGCTTNSECSQKESCVNSLCVSPCNCGSNAECKVTNHYPICYCQPGYSGNPLTGCTKVGCQSDGDCGYDKQCYNGECINPCLLGVPCATNAECYGDNHRAACRCTPGYEGNPFERCERVECHVDGDCPSDHACLERHCINPCLMAREPVCAPNAICYVQNHAAGCRCPEYLPMGNPTAFCERSPPAQPAEPECRIDVDCPTQQACISNKCVNPCKELAPCSPTARCSVLDTVPVRTMICTCPEGWVPNTDGECRPVVLPVPPGCTADKDCPSNETCVNRLCRNPCNCGTNSKCFVQNHRPICSCEEGFEGNPNIACYAVGCRSDSECDSGKACINANCINPCIVNNPCGTNAECYTYGNQAECRCLSGFRGNPRDRCFIIGCRSNNDCPNDRACINEQCINPCVYENNCAPRAECRVQNHLSLCRCPPGFIGNPYIGCRTEPQPECKYDGDCPNRLACIEDVCKNPCTELEPCHRPADCLVLGTIPVRSMICVCPSGYISNGSGTCKATPPITEVGVCIRDSDCPADKACVKGICRNPCNCGPNAECTVKDHKPVCICKQGYDGNPEIECTRVGCRSDDDCSNQHSCVNNNCMPACAPDGSSCGTAATCYGSNHRAICDCPTGLIGNPKLECRVVGCRSNSECPGNKACINNKCLNPCEESKPCEEAAECRVYNHQPECTCPAGSVGDIDKGCEAVAVCAFEKGFIRDNMGNCVCPPGTGLNENEECARCAEDKGLKVDERGRCVCNFERGMVLDERGNCICPVESGYKMVGGTCGPHTLYRTDFPRPDMVVSCLSDGVQVEIHITEAGFNGVLYVKGHSKDEECRRVVTLPPDSGSRTEIFKVNFGNCGLIHVNGQASFVLVIQKHPKLVTYKAQAYHIKCVYQTGEKNVTLGFNVSMLTTAGTIANTGPPPTCIMKIVTQTGQEISSAEIGDNLQLQVEVQPSSKF